MKGLMIAVVSLSMLTSCFVVGLFLYTDIFQPRLSSGIELPKSDCIEICVKAYQRESVWPKEYHQLVQRCNDIFAEVETCRLR